MSETSTCAQCQAASNSLKQCIRCKSVSYCNRECQKSHWKIHKKDCARLAQETGSTQAGAQDNTLRPAEPQSDTNFQAGGQDENPFTAIHNNKFFHNRAEQTTFQLLIDLLRMRQEDEYSLSQDNMTGTIYNNEPTSEPAFRTFIRKARAVPDFLPPWWTDEKLEECIRYSLNSEDFSLAHAQEKHDIQETWKDSQMPMKLRMLAEKVYGYTPGGHQGTPMLNLMMQQEQGEAAGAFPYMSHLQVSGGR